MRHDESVFERARPVIAFGQSVVARYSAVGGSLVAAGLSFYVFFALAPTTLAIGALAGAFLTEEQVRNGVQQLVDRSPDTLAPLQPALDAIVKLADRGSSGTFTVTTIAAIVVATYVASRVVYGLRATLTRLFGAPERIHGLIDRGFSAIVALVGIVVVVAGLLVLQLLPRILDEFGFESIVEFVGTRAVNWAVLAVFALTICSASIRYLPDISPRVRARSWGVLFATVWMLGSSAVFGLYTSLSNTVGAAIVVFGAPIVLMLWAYLVFVGILIGAAIEAERMGVSKPPRPTPIQWPAWITSLWAKVGFGRPSN
jgi:YihY family inner membrane protein